MRAATARAAMRRGCVWPIRPRSPRPAARQIFGQLRRLAGTGLAADDHDRVLADRARDLVGALRDRQIRRIRDRRLGRRARRALARSSARGRRRSAPLRLGARAPRARSIRARRGVGRVAASHARAARRRHARRAARRRQLTAARRAIRGHRGSALSSPPCGRRHDGASRIRPEEPTMRSSTVHVSPATSLVAALAPAAGRRSRRCRRRHAALGRPRRHADDRPAFAEREPDQQHQPARSTSSWSIRDKKLGHRAGARGVVDAGQPDDVALQAAPGRQVPRRHAVHRRRRRVQLRARARRHVAAARVRRTRRASRRRSTTSPSSSRPTGPTRSSSSTSATINIMSKAWCEKNRATKPQNFTQKEDMITARAGQRHRPVHR